MWFSTLICRSNCTKLSLSSMKKGKLVPQPSFCFIRRHCCVYLKVSLPWPISSVQGIRALMRRYIGHAHFVQQICRYEQYIAVDYMWICFPKNFNLELTHFPVSHHMHIQLQCLLVIYDWTLRTFVMKIIKSIKQLISFSSSLV